jgi:hypothetical protein
MDSPRGVKPKKKDRRLSDSDDKLERSEKSEKPSKTKDTVSPEFKREVKRIQEKLDKIPSFYRMAENFNPLEIVIEMMKSEKAGDKQREIDRRCKEMNESMDVLVSEFYEGFNRAIRTYTNILSNVNESKHTVDTLNDSFSKVGNAFNIRSAGLNGMFNQITEYDCTLQILDIIKEIKEVPEKYQIYISNAEYLKAAKLLVDAERLLHLDILKDIGALSQLKDDIIYKRTTFHEIILKELHILLYMKDLQEDDLEMDEDESMAAKAALKKTMAASANIDVNKAGSLRIDGPSKGFIEMVDQLIESLFVLDRVKFSVETLLEGVRPELNIIIQKTVAEFKKEYEQELANKKLQYKPTLVSGIIDNNQSTTASSKSFEENHFVKLLRVLFNKCKQILYNHREACALFEIKTEKQPIVAAKLEEQFQDQLKEHIAQQQIIAQQQAAQQSKKRANSSATPPTPRGGQGGISVGNTTNPVMLQLILNSNEPFRIPYNIQAVWEEILKELQILIRKYIGDAPSSKTIQMKDSASNDTAPEAPKNGPKLFSFYKSAAFSYFEHYEQSGMTNYNDSDIFFGAVPSPYNLTPIYPLITNFHEQVADLIFSTNVGLREWLDEFISTTFLQHIKLDYKKRAVISTEGTEAFKSKDKIIRDSSNEEQRPVLNSAREIFHCIKELYLDMISMPQYRDEFSTIMESAIMVKYLDACQEKYSSLVQDADIGKVISNPEIFTRLQEGPWWRRIQKEARLQQLQQLQFSMQEKESYEGVNINNHNINNVSGPGSSVDASGKKNYPREHRFSGNSSSLTEMINAEVEKTFMDDFTREQRDFEREFIKSEQKIVMGVINQIFSVPTNAKDLMNQLQFNRKWILEVSRIGLLANMHNSLNWFADRIFQLFRYNPLDAEEIENSIPRMSPRLSDQPRITENMLNLVQNFKVLADKCLLTLHEEFRLRCYYFLDKIKSTSYSFDSESREPDAFVISLNDDLVACQEVLVVYLSQSKIRFLLASLSYLMGAVLINSLTKIKSINKWGVRKMCRNVFALQQNLTNIIISTDEEPFEKARKYYELLNISQEEVLVHIAENSGDISKLFSYDEYKTVLEMMSPDRQINSQMREILEQKVNEAYMHV